MTETLHNWFERMPVVAILRGVTPREVVAVGEALLEAGIGIIEIPLNSPDPLDSISRLRKATGERCVVGAGTVLTVSQVEQVANAGASIVVSPNTAAGVITRSLELGLIPMPGWGTATEACSAYAAGARFLKLFPAATYGPGHVRAVSAVLPPDCHLLAVGGVGAAEAQAWLAAGVTGLGIGTQLYQPGNSAAEVGTAAAAVVAALGRDA